jgi:hypothetical protein
MGLLSKLIMCYASLYLCAACFFTSLSDIFISTTLFFLEMVGVGSNVSTITCLSNTPEFLMELGMVEVN